MLVQVRDALLQEAREAVLATWNDVETWSWMRSYAHERHHKAIKQALTVATERWENAMDHLIAVQALTVEPPAVAPPPGDAAT
jgi:hypothetical protein